VGAWSWSQSKIAEATNRDWQNAVLSEDWYPRFPVLETASETKKAAFDPSDADNYRRDVLEPIARALRADPYGAAIEDLRRCFMGLAQLTRWQRLTEKYMQPKVWGIHTGCRISEQHPTA